MASRVTRIARYLQHMFPPVTLVPGTALQFFAIYFAFQALAGVEPLVVTWRSLAGAASFILFSLQMRVYDELKDVEVDLKLGRAGDPRYRDRPVVTGEVLVEDIVTLRWVVTALTVAANIWFIGSGMFVAFAIAWVLCWLSFKWFFYPPMQNNLLLAFVTHNPLTMVLNLYIYTVFAADTGAGLPSGAAWMVIIGTWLPVAAWEVSRKIRLPADETDYTTYSKVLGWRAAAVVVVVLLLGATATLGWVVYQGGLGVPGAAVAGVVGLAAAGRVLLFLVAPTTARANLRPVTEAVGFAVAVGIPVALAIDRGLDLALSI